MNRWIALLTLLVQFHLHAKEFFTWPDGIQAAVILGYDDALHSQLDTAIPALNRHGFQGSFYLTLSVDSFTTRLEDWRQAAKDGHELANHSLFHQCSRSKAGRDWVAQHLDLDSTALDKWVAEIKLANDYLHSIDGKTARTFTTPCGDVLANGKFYLDEVKPLFVAMRAKVGGVPKSMASESPFAVTFYAPSGTSGKELIDMVKLAGKHGTMINFTFHGIGGDHLSVDTQAHEALLQFLASNRDKYWTDTFINVMQYVKQEQKRIGVSFEEKPVSEVFSPSPEEKK